MRKLIPAFLSLVLCACGGHPMNTDAVIQDFGCEAAPDYMQQWSRSVHRQKVRSYGEVFMNRTCVFENDGVIFASTDDAHQIRQEDCYLDSEVTTYSEISCEAR